MPVGLAIHRLHARTPAGAQPVAARLALQALGADLEDALPRGLPPQALLWVRRLQLQAPEAALLRPAPAAWRQDWIAAGREQFDAALAQAARPALGPVSVSAPAVLFADAAEMLACLALAAQSGELDRWWWRGLLGRAWPQWQTAWVARPEAQAGARSLLLRLARGVTTRPVIEPRLWAELDRLSGAPRAVRADVEAEAVAVEPFGGTGEAAGQPVRAPESETTVVAARVVDGAQPAEASARAPLLTAFVEPGAGTQALAVQGDPPEAVAPERAAVDAAMSTSHSDESMWPVEPRREQKPPSARMAARGDLSVPSVPTPVPLRRRGRPAPSVPQAPLRSSARSEPEAPGPLGLPSAAPAPDMRKAVASRPAVGAATLSSRRAEPQRPADPVARSKAGGPQAPAAMRPAAPVEASSAAWPWPEALRSRQAPLLFIVNALLEDGLYPDFTRPRDPGLPVPLWVLLAALARAWRLPVDDALQAALAERSPDWIAPEAMPAAPGAAAGPWADWLAAYARSLRRRLCRRLGLRASSWQAALTLSRPARLWLSEAEWAAEFDLETHDVAWRLAGLDRDPGWLPSVGCTLRFNFIC